MKGKVLVIVVSYNGKKWLERCLSSVDSSADLYVFDNDSTDGSADFVKANFPSAHLVRSAENLGFSVPNNLGFKWALEHGYQYAYLLNQDAWLEPGALEKLVAAADTCPEYGVLSPLQMTDGYKELDKQFNKYYSRVKVQDQTKPCEIKFVMAAHWLVRLSAVEKIGLFNEELFPFYGQDNDWCNRLHFCGLKVGILPCARAVHDREYRKENVEKLVYRNYYSGSLLRLCNPLKPFFTQLLFVCLFTLVKAVKYHNLLVFNYFRRILKELPMVKQARKRALARKCA